MLPLSHTEESSLTQFNIKNIPNSEKELGGGALLPAKGGPSTRSFHST